MNYLMIISLLLTSVSFSQQLAKITNDDKLVILYENGTWEYVNNAKEKQVKQVKKDKQSAEVFITKTGKKYHRDECRYLKSSIPISLADAGKRGYTRCSVCLPPSLSTAPTKKESYTPKKNYQSDGRCTATTQKGTRCKRSAQSGRSYCWQHP